MGDVGERQSRQARGYGHKAEKYVIDRYDLVEDHESWRDAKRANGDAVEVKAAKYKMANGRTGRFLIRRRSHERLRRADGWYVFVAYRPRGQGVEVLECEMKRARAVRIGSWQSLSGDRQDSKQIVVTDVFG